MIKVKMRMNLRIILFYCRLPSIFNTVRPMNELVMLVHDLFTSMPMGMVELWPMESKTNLNSYLLKFPLPVDGYLCQFE